MKRLVSMMLIVLIGLTFLGCSAGPDETPGEKVQVQKSQTEAVKNQPANESTEETDKTTENNKVQPEKELNKKIEVLVEGNKEMRDAVLAESEELGFQIYVLKNFSLESEEPGKDIILSEFDGEFFARIEKLDGKTNLNEYKNQLKSALAQTGKVTEIDPATLSHEKFRDSKFCLLMESGYEDDNSKKTSVNYLVKDFGGQLFMITFHMPLKEAAEGISPSLWAMISTLEVK